MMRRGFEQLSRRTLHSSAVAASQAAAGHAPKKLFILNYTYPSDIVTKRVPFRSEHLALAHRWADEGRLMVGGAYGMSSRPSGGLMIFNVSSADEVMEFVRADPYRKIVVGFRVDEFHAVAGCSCPDHMRLHKV